MADSSPQNVPATTNDEQTVPQSAAPDPMIHLQADPRENQDSAQSDTDSVFDAQSFSTTSTSISSSMFNYKYENGRRYHAFREGEYMLPNDEREQDRLDLQHHMFKLVLDGNLFRAPISKHPQRVLDMGTGTGIWAIDFADEFPSAMVIGNDLSPIQPGWVPPNCKFVVDDLEAEWLYTPAERFDFIHARGTNGLAKDWHQLYSQAYHHMKPGGWIEMQEYETWCKSDDDPELTNCTTVPQWQTLINQANDVFGKELNVAVQQKQHLIDAGFVDVRDDMYKLPLGPWAKDPKLKNIGIYQLENMLDCVETFTLAPLTRIFQWDNERIQLLMAGVRKDFHNWRKTHLYVVLHFVYGRKPKDVS